MSSSRQALSRNPVARLSRRIVFWVFTSVIVIETLIFIPSFYNREKELLNQLKEVSTARVALIMQIVAPDASDDVLFAHVKKLLNDRVVVGGALFKADGEKIGEFGEMPELRVANVNQSGMTFLLSRDKSRYDIACSPVELQRDYRLILRHNSSTVKQDLWAFFLRIAVLVVIISLFVTIGTWIPLRRIVVNPILKLRNDLIRAGETISKDQKTPEFSSANIHRQDELGEVIRAFHHMYSQISDAIDERKNAEEALQESFQQVEAYSKVLNNELEKGRQMQVNFLPNQLLQMPGWETAAFFKPARQVSGDFYDVFKLSEDSIGFVIADVCDKGVGAALFMALFRSLIRIFSGQTTLEGSPMVGRNGHFNDQVPQDSMPIPAEVKALNAVQLTNNYIALNHGDLAMFATLFFGILNPANGLLNYINGGHEPLYIVGPEGGIKANLSATGPSVGIQSKIEFKVKQAQMEPGDILLGYTDGVTEASAADGRFFTRDRFLTILERPVPTATDLIDQIATTLQNYIGQADQFDDITLLAMRRIPERNSISAGLG